MFKNSRPRWFIMGSGIIIITLGFVVSGGAALQQTTSTVTVKETPVMSESDHPRIEEQVQMAAVMATQMPPPSSEELSGPSTQGSILIIAEKSVKLPKDAEVLAFILTINCPQDFECPKPPFYTLKRGKFNVYVNIQEGTIWEDPRISEAERASYLENYQFLFDALAVATDSIRKQTFPADSQPQFDVLKAPVESSHE